jgi:hypothetical protein
MRAASDSRTGGQMTQVPRKFTLMDRTWTYLLDVVGLLFCGRCFGPTVGQHLEVPSPILPGRTTGRCAYAVRSSMEGSFVLQMRGTAEV